MKNVLNISNEVVYSWFGHDNADFEYGVNNWIKKLVAQYQSDLKNDNVSNLFARMQTQMESAGKACALQVLMSFYEQNYPTIFYDWLSNLETVTSDQFASFYFFTKTTIEMPELTYIGNYGFANSNLEVLKAPKLKTISSDAFFSSDIKEIYAPEECTFPLEYESLIHII